MNNLLALPARASKVHSAFLPVIGQEPSGTPELPRKYQERAAKDRNFPLNCLGCVGVLAILPKIVTAALVVAIFFALN